MAIGASQGNVIASAFVRIQPETSGFGPALRQTLATNLLQLEKQQEGFFNKIKGSVATTAKLFATAGATSLSLFGAAAFASAKDLEKTSNAFKGLYGSVGEGQKAFDEVFKLAERTPFEGSGLAKDYQKFVASYSASGMPIQDASKKTLNILQTLADSGSALGASSDNISGFSLALTQTIGKGKLTGEEIRQMTNNLAGFNVRAAVATKLYGNSLPESVAKLDKSMKKGEVTADIAIQGILEGLNKIPGAAGASARQLRTVSGAMSTIKDIFERSTFEGLQEPLKVLSNTLVDNSEVFRSVFKTMSQELGGIVVTASGLMSEIMNTFDESFGKLAIGGLRAAGGALYGFQDGLKESLSYLGVLGQLMQDNQGYFVIMGKTLGNFSAGFSRLFTHMVKGMEPAFKTGVMFFEMFSLGFKNVAEIFGPQLQRGFFDTGIAMMGLFSSLKKSFGELFDSEVANDFIKGIASVSRTLLELLIRPLDALSEKTDGIASGFEKMFKTWTPPLKDFEAAVLGLADAFAGIISGADMDILSDFVAGTGKHLIEAFTALATYGAIFVDVMESLMGVMGPLNALFGNFAEQAGAAFLVLKLTGNPLLALIALFKDLDTGLVVFFLTLSKVVPMIRQMQTALSSVSTLNIVNGLGGIVSGMRGIQTTAIPTLGAFTKAMRDAGQISDISYRQIMNNGMFRDIQGMNINDPKATARMSSLVNNDGFLRNAKDARNLNVALSDVNRNLGAASFQSEYLGRVTTQAAHKSTSAMNTLHLGVRQVANGYAGLTKNVNTAGQAVNTAGQAGVTWQRSANGGMVALARNGEAATKATGNATAATGKLGMGLGGIAGLVGSIGLGVGISLLTSHLASSAEQANKTKQQISELADLSFNYQIAKTGVEKTQALTEGVAGIQQRFGDDTKALGEFNSLLARNNLSTEQFYRDLNGSEKTRTKTVGKLVGDLLDTTKKKAGGDIFESSQKGKRDITNKTEAQALKFYKDLAKIDGASLERGLDSGDAGVKDLIAKRLNMTYKEFEKQSTEKKTKLLTKAGVDNLFNIDPRGNLSNNAGGGSLGSDSSVQLKNKYKDVAIILGQISQAAGDGAYKLEQSNKALKDSETIAKDAAVAYKTFGESQKLALSSSSAFFDKVFEYGNPENLKKLQGTVQAARDATFDINKLVQTQGGRDFLTPFSGLVEAEAAIKTNINAPVIQTIGLLKQSNEEFVKLGEAAGLSKEEIAKVQIGIGDLSFAEDFGELVNGLADAGKVGGANLKAIIAEAVKLEGPQQKAFLDTIINKDTRKTIEKGLKDLKGSVVLDLDPSVFSNLSTAIENAGKKDINMKFLEGVGLRSIAVRNSIDALFSAATPQLSKLNEQFRSGAIDEAEYSSSVKKSRESLIQTLVDEGIKLKDAQAIYKSMGLQKETAELKLFIDGKSPEERMEIIKQYLSSFDDAPYAIKFAATFELDPEQAVKDFVTKAEGADQTNKKYAFKGIPTADLAEVSKGQSSTFIALKVMPEIEPGLLDSFFSNLNAKNHELAMEVVPSMSEEQLKNTLGQIPVSEAVSIIAELDQFSIVRAVDALPKQQQIDVFTQLDQASKEHLLLNLPKEDVISLVASMDQENLSRQLALMPPFISTQILAKLPEETRTTLQTKIDNYKLTSVVYLEPGNEIEIPGVSVPLNFITNGSGTFGQMNADAQKGTQGSVPGVKFTGSFTSGATTLTPKKKPVPANVRALGGIVGAPELTLLGEAGLPEVVIPMGQVHDARALSLLKKSGLYEKVVKDASMAQQVTTSDNSQKVEVNIDMRGTKTQDPEGMALLLASRLTNGIRR